FSVPSVIAVLAGLLVLYPGSGSAKMLDPHCATTLNWYSSQKLGPWTAMLHENGRITCAGTLIHRQFILTAAHCIREGEQLQVRLGLYGRSGHEKPEDYDVILAFRHRRYNRETMENDIGMLQLARALEFSFTDHIIPICIDLEPSSQYLNWIDKNVNDFIGTAWNLIERKDKYQSGEFYAINIRRLRQHDCQRGRTIKDKLQFCGYNPQSDVSCNGPSGSALSWTASNHTIYQLGIASYNDEDCRNRRVYTDVLRYSEWIDNIVSVY
ncbi:hypothetical protein KR032_008377, partial [Drosophila birchii]